VKKNPTKPKYLKKRKHQPQIQQPAISKEGTAAPAMLSYSAITLAAGPLAPSRPA